MYWTHRRKWSELRDRDRPVTMRAWWLHLAAAFLVPTGYARGGSAPSQRGSSTELPSLVRPPGFASGSAAGDRLEILPPLLTFKHSPTCIPAISLIDVVNTAEEGGGTGGGDARGSSGGNAVASASASELHILGIVSDNPQFHPAMFKPQVLPPQGRTTIQIIYLPRSAGDVEGTLTISTSVGDVYYPIQATAVPNPYRLHPFVGTKIPAGVVYSRPIIMYNPTDEPLHVREVFTTESFLHLHLPDDSGRELPSGGRGGGGLGGLSGSGGGGDDDDDDDNDVDGGGGGQHHSSSSSEEMWEIPPRSEKEIIHLMFRATSPGPFSGYVHVKTDRENMVLPVELTVLKGGLHPTPKELDFGILTSPDERRVVPVSLLNSGSSPVALLEAMASVHDPQLAVAYTRGTVIGPGEVAEGVVKLQYAGLTPGSVSGKVVMTTNHSNAGLASVEVYYTAHVLHGGVGYERGHVSFVVPVLLNGPSSTPGSSGSGGVTGGGDGGGGRVKGDEASSPPVEEVAAEEVVRSVPFTNYFPTPLLLRSVSVEQCGGALTVDSDGNDSSDGSNSNPGGEKDGGDTTADDDDSNGAITSNNNNNNEDGSSSGSSPLSPPPVAKPQGKWPDLNLRFNAGVASRTLSLPHTCTLTLVTNVSTHHIPVHVYNGKVHVELSAEARGDGSLAPPSPSSSSAPAAAAPPISAAAAAAAAAAALAASSIAIGGSYAGAAVVVDFGRLALNQTRTRTFNVTNLNPVPVNITIRPLTSPISAEEETTSAAVVTTANEAAAGGTSSKASSLTGTGESAAFSGFRFRGQFLSRHAGLDLVEIYEDMVGQGAVDPAAFLPYPSLAAPPAASSSSSTATSGGSGGGGGASNGGGGVVNNGLAQPVGRGFSRGRPHSQRLHPTPSSAHDDGVYSAQEWAQGSVRQGAFSLLPGHTAMFEVGVWSGFKAPKPLLNLNKTSDPKLSADSSSSSSSSSSTKKKGSGVLGRRAQARMEREDKALKAKEAAARALLPPVPELSLVLDTPVESFQLSLQVEAVDGSVGTSAVAVSRSSSSSSSGTSGDEKADSKRGEIDLLMPSFAKRHRRRHTQRDEQQQGFGGEESGGGGSVLMLPLEGQMGVSGLLTHQPIRLKSTFLDDLELCGLQSSLPNWIQGTIATTTTTTTSSYSASSSLISLCPSHQASPSDTPIIVLRGQRWSTDSGSGSSSSSSGGSGSVNTRSSLAHLEGAVAFSPQPPCKDAWSCVARWANEIAEDPTLAHDYRYHRHNGTITGENRNGGGDGDDEEGDDDDDDDDDDNQENAQRRGTAQRASAQGLAVSATTLPLSLTTGPSTFSSSSTSSTSTSTSSSSWVLKLKDAEAFARVWERWEEFKDQSLHVVTAEVSASVGVGFLPSLFAATTTLEVPSLSVEFAGPGTPVLLPASSSSAQGKMKSHGGGDGGGSNGPLSPPPPPKPPKELLKPPGKRPPVGRWKANAGRGLMNAYASVLEEFPLTAVGEVASGYLKVYNPSPTTPLALQLLVLESDVDVLGAGPPPPTMTTTTASQTSHGGKQGRSSDTSDHSKPPSSTPLPPWWDFRLTAVNAGVGSPQAKFNNNPGSGDHRGGGSGGFVPGSNRVMTLVNTDTGEVASSSSSSCSKVDGDNNGECYQSRSPNHDGGGGVGGGGVLLPRWIPDAPLAPGPPPPTALSPAEVASDPAAQHRLPPPFFFRGQPVVVAPLGYAFLGPLLFRPPRAGVHRGAVFIRNNLTTLHRVDLSGQGGVGKPVLRPPVPFTGGKGGKGGLHSPSSMLPAVQEVGSVFTLRFHVKSSQWATPASTTNPFSSSSWPISPVTHLLRVENHGEVPFQVTGLHIGGDNDGDDDDDDVSGGGGSSGGGSGGWIRSLWSSGGSDGKSKNDKNRSSFSPSSSSTSSALFPHACPGSSASGFLVEGCPSLPLNLGPLQAWDFPVHHFTDCAASSEVRTLVVETSAGSFDVILHAVFVPTLPSPPHATTHAASVSSVIKSCEVAKQRAAAAAPAPLLSPLAHHYSRPSSSSRPGAQPFQEGGTSSLAAFALFALRVCTVLGAAAAIWYGAKDVWTMLGAVTAHRTSLGMEELREGKEGKEEEEEEVKSPAAAADQNDQNSSSNGNGKPGRNKQGKNGTSAAGKCDSSSSGNDDDDDDDNGGGGGRPATYAAGNQLEERAQQDQDDDGTAATGAAPSSTATPTAVPKSNAPTRGGGGGGGGAAAAAASASAPTASAKSKKGAKPELLSPAVDTRLQQPPDADAALKGILNIIDSPNPSPAPITNIATTTPTGEAATAALTASATVSGRPKSSQREAAPKKASAAAASASAGASKKQVGSTTKAKIPHVPATTIAAVTSNRSGHKVQQQQQQVQQQVQQQQAQERLKQQQAQERLKQQRQQLQQQQVAFAQQQAQQRKEVAAVSRKVVEAPSSSSSKPAAPASSSSSSSMAAAVKKATSSAVAATVASASFPFGPVRRRGATDDPELLEPPESPSSSSSKKKKMAASSSSSSSSSTSACPSSKIKAAQQQQNAKAAAGRTAAPPSLLPYMPSPLPAAAAATTTTTTSTVASAGGSGGGARGGNGRSGAKTSSSQPKQAVSRATPAVASKAVTAAAREEPPSPSSLPLTKSLGGSGGGSSNGSSTTTSSSVAVAKGVIGRRPPPLAPATSASASTTSSNSNSSAAEAARDDVMPAASLPSSSSISMSSFLDAPRTAAVPEPSSSSSSNSSSSWGDLEDAMLKVAAPLSPNSTSISPISTPPRHTATVTTAAAAAAAAAPTGGGLFMASPFGVSGNGGGGGASFFSPTAPSSSSLPSITGSLARNVGDDALGGGGGSSSSSGLSVAPVNRSDSDDAAGDLNIDSFFAHLGEQGGEGSFDDGSTLAGGGGSVGKGGNGNSSSSISSFGLAGIGLGGGGGGGGFGAGLISGSSGGGGGGSSLLSSLADDSSTRLFAAATSSSSSLDAGGSPFGGAFGGCLGGGGSGSSGCGNSNGAVGGGGGGGGSRFGFAYNDGGAAAAFPSEEDDAFPTKAKDPPGAENTVAATTGTTDTTTDTSEVALPDYHKGALAEPDFFEQSGFFGGAALDDDDDDDAFGAPNSDDEHDDGDWE